MGELSVATVDIVIAAVILVSAVYAALRGLLRETLAIFSWALAAYVTLRVVPRLPAHASRIYRACLAG